MDVSQALIDKIIEFEGLRLEAYKCPRGIWTIGVGHTYGVKQGMKITRSQAISLLKCDLLTHRTYIDDLGLKLTQGQYDALVDFSFNCGIANLKRSTLLKKARAKYPKEEVAKEFSKWVYAGGAKLNGLIKRRAWEAQRYVE